MLLNFWQAAWVVNGFFGKVDVWAAFANWLRLNVNKHEKAFWVCNKPCLISPVHVLSLVGLVCAEGKELCYLLKLEQLL